MNSRTLARELLDVGCLTAHFDFAEMFDMLEIAKIAILARREIWHHQGRVFDSCMKKMDSRFSPGRMQKGKED